MVKSKLEYRKLVCDFYNKHPDWQKSKIVKHFETMNFSRRNVYYILKKLENNESIERKLGSGRKSSLNDPRVRQSLKAVTAGHVAKSYRELGRKYGCDGKTIKVHLNKMGITRKSRKTKPAVTDAQLKIQKCRLQKLIKNTFSANKNIKCVMDDETYLTLDGNEWQGSYYYESEKSPAADNVKFIDHTSSRIGEQNPNPPVIKILWLFYYRYPRNKIDHTLHQYPHNKTFMAFLLPIPP